MRRLILSLGFAAGVALFMAHPAEAAIGTGVVLPTAEAAPGVQVTPVYWTWHGRQWHHRRYYARRYYGGRWVPGYYRYY